jgi:hypothetical protein
MEFSNSLISNNSIVTLGKFSEITKIDIVDIEKIYYYDSNSVNFTKTIIKESQKADIFNKLNVYFEIKTFNPFLYKDCAVTYNKLMSAYEKLYVIQYKKNETTYEISCILYTDRDSEDKKTNLYFWTNNLDLFDYYVSIENIDV